MQLGRYEIESYYVVVNNQTESRQRVVYIGSNEEDYFIERYYGTIRDGYLQSNSFLRNLNFSDIKSHIVGESIVIFDKGIPPMPLIYISISGIQSIDRDSDIKITIVNSQIEPTSLEFLTKFDCDQAYSLLIHLLENPKINIGSIDVDTKPPTIFFYEKFFGSRVIIDGNPDLVGPLSTEDGNIFRVNLEGVTNITKYDILSKLIYDITDNRDGSISLNIEDIMIYKDVISINNNVDEITGVGNYIVKFNLIDLGRNENTSIVIISIK